MILLDTQTVVWASFEREHISKRAATAINRAYDRSDGIAIASHTLWEIALIVKLGKVSIPTSTIVFLNEIQNRYEVLPVTAAIAERSVNFTDPFPKDPADRIIGATALIHNLSLITSDRKIRDSGQVPCIW